MFSEPGPIEGEVEEDTATVIQPPGMKTLTDSPKSFRYNAAVADEK